MTDDFYTTRSPITGANDVAMKRQRYTGIATFMRTPLAENLTDLDIALIGVPLDGGLARQYKFPVRRGSAFDPKRTLAAKGRRFDQVGTLRQAL